MTACERAQEEFISSLIDKEVVESESHWIATTLGAYNKACNEVEIFISYFVDFFCFLSFDPR